MIAVEGDRGIWRLTLARREKANALTGEMLDRLLEAVAEARERARGLILTGEGSVFSAGADLDEVRGQGLAVSDRWERLSAAIAALPFVTVAALNGTVAGGAMGMVLACDMRLAVPSAQFFYPALRRGVLPQVSDAARLHALIGPARTRFLLLGGARLDAEEARAFGLIERIVAPEALIPAAEALLGDAAAADPELLRRVAALCPPPLRAKS